LRRRQSHPPVVDTGPAGGDFRLAGEAGLLPEFASRLMAQARFAALFAAQPLNRPGVERRHNVEEFLAQPAMACLNLRKVSSEEIE
jgi:hypothetical protein